MSNAEPGPSLRSRSTSTTRVHRWAAGARGARLVARLPASAVLVLASCGVGHGSGANDRAIAIYSVVIRTVVTQPPGGRQVTVSHAPVFVVAADTHAPISLEVQAGIVDALHAFATIRFVDERSEAIDDADPHKSVVNDGILVTLGRIPTGTRVVNVDAQRYERAGASASYRIRLQRSGSRWIATRVQTL